ncbi:uncharacterized protein [Ptychodera flava]|uniref:uncharacterized protein n=1 Tax=Ptychodera flava TaxID=63121 RepID=UPI00396AB138
MSLMLWIHILVWWAAICIELTSATAVSNLGTVISTNHLEVNVTDVCRGCRNGGHCNESIAECVCKRGFKGRHCDIVRYNCIAEAGCYNQGQCLDTGVCRCTAHYFGDRCEYKDAWLHREVNPHNDERSTIVSVTSGMIVMVIICSTIVCMNFKRPRQPSRVIAENSEELSDIVQVDGPPRMRHQFIGQDRGNACTTNWFSFQGSRPSTSHGGGLHGVMTAPAVLQGTYPKKYTLIVSMDDESPGSVITMPGDSQNSIPPPYDEAVERYSDPRSDDYNVWQRNQSSTGIFMQVAKSSNNLNSHSNSPDNLNLNTKFSGESGSVISSDCHFSVDDDEMGSMRLSSNRSSVAAGTLRSYSSGIMALRRSSTDDSFPFIDKDASNH